MSRKHKPPSLIGLFKRRVRKPSRPRGHCWNSQAQRDTGVFLHQTKLVAWVDWVRLKAIKSHRLLSFLTNHVNQRYCYWGLGCCLLSSVLKSSSLCNNFEVCWAPFIYCYDYFVINQLKYVNSIGSEVRFAWLYHLKFTLAIFVQCGGRTISPRTYSQTEYCYQLLQITGYRCHVIMSMFICVIRASLFWGCCA